MRIKPVFVAECKHITVIVSEPQRKIRYKMRQNMFKTLQKLGKIPCPRACDSNITDSVLQHQNPADHPRHKFAHCSISVGISTACNRNHCGNFGITQRRKHTRNSCQYHRNYNRGTCTDTFGTALNSASDYRKNSRTDNRADTDYNKVKNVQCLFQLRFFAYRNQFIGAFFN